MQINCSSTWQWELANSGSVEFDADIVGPGVIASFISAASTAFLSLVVAFATYSIPTELINNVDRVIARALRGIFTSIRSLLRLPGIARTDGEEGREDRIQIFQTFMLSVSDQVLVSELAILIATFARYVDITLYSVNVVVALGCLASTVHLAMMPLLVGQMRKHRVIKGSRSISMVIAAAMLVTLLVFQISDTWGNGTHIYFLCALRDWQLDVSVLRYYWVSFTVQLLVPIFVIYGNYEVIRLLYSKSQSGPSENPPHFNAKADPPRKRQRLSRIHKDYTEMRTYSQQSWIRNKWARHKAREAVEKQIGPRKQRIYAFLIAETWTFYECQESFLWRILWLLSGNVYGLTDVLSTRSETDGISGERDTMGYGQIVPLVLLILPVFAAIQSIYDYRDRKKLTKDQKQPVEEPPTTTLETPLQGVESQLLANMIRVDSGSMVRQLTRSTTTATESDPSATFRRRQSALANSPTPNGEIIITVYSSHTLSSREDGERTPVGVDGSLAHWARSDKYEEMPFVQTLAYVHTVFMLAFTILYGWGTADGSDYVVLPLNLVLGLIILRRLSGFLYFWRFSSNQKNEDQDYLNASHTAQPARDNSQAMMYAHGSNAVAAEEDES
ncbi:hypothetical protein BDV10DRAFT_180739 [Aspergillus recurvatus]